MGGCVCGVRGCVSAWLWVYVWGVHAMPNGIVCVFVSVCMCVGVGVCVRWACNANCVCVCLRLLGG